MKNRRDGNPWWAWFILVLALALPGSSPAQTRFFEHGDSGVTASWGTFSEAHTLGYRDTGARVVYTHRGAFDLGLGYAPDAYHSGFETATKSLFGTLVLLRRGTGTDLGLEAEVQFAAKSTPWGGGHDPVLFRILDRTLQSNLRGFIRPFGRESGAILGLSLLYRFNKYQIRDVDDAVTFGHDYGEFGFGGDFQALGWGFAHFSLGAEYVQDRYYRESWDWSYYASIGVLIGRRSGRPAE